MGCEFTSILIGMERMLKFRCDGCKHGASIEQSEACMREIVNRLTEDPAVDAVVLADPLYEREYRGSSLEALKELASAYEECRYRPLKFLATGDCERCEAERKQLVESMIEELPGHPWKAYNDLMLLSADIWARARRGAEKCRRCRGYFHKQSLVPTLETLRRVKLVSYGKRGRKGYAELITPLIKPRFSTSRVTMEPSPGAKLVDAYNLEGSEVRIYRLPDGLQHLYFLILPEYRLPPEHLTLLNKARELLLNHGSEDMDLSDLSHARERIRRLSARLMTKLAVEGKLDITKENIETLAGCLAKFSVGLGALETILSDARVQDIYIDAPLGKSPVHLYHGDYEECLTNVYLTPEDAESLSSRFRAISGRPFSEADPVLDLTLPEFGARVAVIGRPLSPEGVAFALRRHKTTPWTLPQFVRNRFLTPEAAGLLSLLVDSQASMLIAGSRGAGKCVDGDTVLQLGDGSLQKISEVVKWVIGKSKKIVDTGDGICCDLKQNGLRLEAFSLCHDFTIKPAGISKVWLRRAPSKMMRIKARSGREIVTTPEHPFFVLENGEIIQKRADQLSVNEFVATPRKLPEIKGRIKKEINREALGEVRLVGPEKGVRELLSQLASRGEMKETGNSLGISYRELMYLKNKADSIKPRTLRLLQSLKDVPLEIKGIRFPTSSGILPLNMAIEIDENCARFLGLLLSDGHLDERGVIFFNREQDMLEEFGQLAEKLFGARGNLIKPENRCPSHRIASKPLALLIHELFSVPFGCKSSLVEIPKEILCSTNSILAAFISAYFDCDGNVHFSKKRGGKVEIELSTASKEMSIQMQLALTRFGIISFRREKLVGGKTYYVLVIRGEECKHFFEHIGFKEKRKRATLQAALENMSFNSNVDVVPNVFELLKKAKSEVRAVFRVKLDQKNVERKKLRRSAKNFMLGGGPASRRLIQLASSDIFWDKIVEIEKIPYEKSFVYDLTIEGAHNFVANGFIAHNTSLLGALMLEIPQKFRIISIEDTLELPIAKFQSLGFKIQSLHVQSAVVGSETELKAEDALRAALRLGESVLVIGEVRGVEAKVLYEAMRIGAAGNSVMGTIHGATTRDVFDRVVYDLGIPPTSFKATDAIIVAAPIRPGGSVSRVRRVVQIAEVGKDWKVDPIVKGGFADLMIYDQRDDQLKPTKKLWGSSQLMAAIARKWGVKQAEVMRNLELRARVQWALVKASAELDIPKLLEAEFVVRSNNALHQLLEEQLQLHRSIDYPGIFRRWQGWLEGEIPR